MSDTCSVRIHLGRVTCLNDADAADASHVISEALYAVALVCVSSPINRRHCKLQRLAQTPLNHPRRVARARAAHATSPTLPFCKASPSASQRLVSQPGSKWQLRLRPHGRWLRRRVLTPPLRPLQPIALMPPSPAQSRLYLPLMGHLLDRATSSPQRPPTPDRTCNPSCRISPRKSTSHDRLPMMDPPT